MLGYSVASQLLGRALPQPTEDVMASFLARTVRLNELYLALAERYSPAQAPFVWIAASATETVLAGAQLPDSPHRGTPPCARPHHRIAGGDIFSLQRRR